MPTIRGSSTSLSLQPAKSKIRIISQFKTPLKNILIDDSDRKHRTDINFKNTKLSSYMEQQKGNTFTLSRKFKADENIQDYKVDY